MKRWKKTTSWPVIMCMKYKASILAPLLALMLLGMPARAAEASPAPTPAPTAEAEDVEPLLSREAGAAGLVLLLAFGAVASRKGKEHEELDLTGEKIGDPYSRLKPEKKRSGRPKKER